MEINRLSQEELSYEMHIRDLPLKKVEEMRVTLREALRVERDGRSLVVEPYPFSFADDAKALQAKVGEVEELLGSFTGDSNSPEYKKITTKVEWALKRLSRSKPENSEQKSERTTLRANLLLALGSLKLKADGPSEDEDSSEDTADRSILAAAAGSAKVRVPIHKWDIKFSGDPGQSVNSFLERVHELSEARGVSKYHLFRSALDLFSGRALLWYRANRAKLQSWQEVVKELKKEFLPKDYDDRLMEELRRRTQGKEETIGMYAAVMTSMFARLSDPLPESMQLRLLKRNLNPFYQTQLALVEVGTVQELIDLGRQLQAVRHAVESFAPPPSRRHSQLLEPDLAYVATESPAIAPVADQNRRRQDVSNSRVRLPVTWLVPVVRRLVATVVGRWGLCVPIAQIAAIHGEHSRAPHSGLAVSKTGQVGPWGILVRVGPVAKRETVPELDKEGRVELYFLPKYRSS